MNEKLEKWVKKLNGFEYPAYEIEGFQNEMEKDGVIAIYGMSDDLLEFSGVINDEFGAWNGFSGRLTKDLNVFDEKYKSEGEAPQDRIEELPFVRAVWSPEDSQGNIFASWKIETDLPHGEFEIFEDGELFCVGVIVDTEDIKNWIRR